VSLGAVTRCAACFDAGGFIRNATVMKNLHIRDAGGQWIHHMRLGQWEQAWQVSDVMLELGRFRHPWLPRHQQALWNGQSPRGKRVLVHCYHGLGDTIQFVRFAAALHDIAATVSVWAQPKLLPLLRTVGGIDFLLPLHDGDPQVQRDVDIELMELPHALRVTLDTLPRRVPYIHVAELARIADDPRPRIGIVSQSGTWDPRRSVPPALMESLTSRRDVAWKALQRGPALAACSNDRVEIPRIASILDEAAELRALDLLITVDTLSAHLAGALGVRTWTLLPAEADWRWMQDREDSPWYPTMRLFRQPRAGDWPAVIERLGAELEVFVRRNGVCCDLPS